MSDDKVWVAFKSQREKDLTLALTGRRVRGVSMEQIVLDGKRYRILSVRPATPAEIEMWNLLMGGEVSWGNGGEQPSPSGTS